MTRALLLSEVLDSLMEHRASEAARACDAFFSRTGDPYALALSAFVTFWARDFPACATRAVDALARAEDPEALFLARAAWGFAASGVPEIMASVQAGVPDPLDLAETEWASLETVSGDGAAFVRYALAETSLCCGRLSLAARFVASSGELPPHFLETAGEAHPFLAVMRIMRARLLTFRGQISDATVAAEHARASATSPLGTLLSEAALCLIRGNASERVAVRAIADRLEFGLPAPQDYASSGCYLLVAYGLVAVGDVARAARFVLTAGGSADLVSLNIVDMSLGLELLVAAAIADGDGVAAASWLQNALRLADHPIAASAVARMQSRVALQEGRGEDSAAAAERAVRFAAAEGRAIELAESEIVLSRARIALREPAVAASLLEELAIDSLTRGHRAARESASRELRAIGRRLRPVAGVGWDGLSSRERDVALLIAEGFSNRAIAAELHVSEHTVQAHVSRVLAAFGVASRIAIVQGLTAMLSADTESDSRSPLTAQQQRVAECIAQGKTNDQVASTLGISAKTVEKHVSEIFRRWGVASRVGIARLVLQRGAEAGALPGGAAGTSGRHGS